jgi:two-component system sensor histidine kinase LytS
MGVGSLTALSCSISTFVAGLIGAVFSKYFRRGKWDTAATFLFAAVMEVLQMVIILCVSKPFSEALALVRVIAVPMICMNSVGMVAFLGTFNIVFIEEDNATAGRIQLAFRIMEQCLSHLKQGLQSREDMEATAEIMYRSLSCSHIVITGKQEILACACGDNRRALAFDEISPWVEKALAEKSVVCHSFDENRILIAAPLIELEQPVGSLVLVEKRQWYSSNTNVTFLKELARLFSTQLELADLDYQKRQRRKAEYKALVSQVNPHFLYNALNTIGCVCRVAPERARELIYTLATYYRQSLEDDRDMVSLATEVYRVMNYLELEKARFEEKLQVEVDVPDDIYCVLPSFVLQPLVENAIEHGVGKEGIRYVKISAKQEKEGVWLKVADHGPGFPKAVLEAFERGEKTKGQGIGLLNVHRRLKAIYGEKGGLLIESGPEGTTVAFFVSQEPVADFEKPKENGGIGYEGFTRR